MSNISYMHKKKQPRRPHHIADWAELRGLSQADMVRALGVDKSLVSRWFNDTTPGEKSQKRLAALFSIEPEDLFRSPADNWLKQFSRERHDLFEILKARNSEELDRIKRMIEAASPPHLAQQEADSGHKGGTSQDGGGPL